jgi:hypothetical protein
MFVKCESSEKAAPEEQRVSIIFNLKKCLKALKFRLNSNGIIVQQQWHNNSLRL